MAHYLSIYQESVKMNNHLYLLSQFVQGIFISNSGDQAHSMSGNGIEAFFFTCYEIPSPLSYCVTLFTVYNFY